MMIFIGAIIVILDNESHTERLIDELCQDVDTYDDDVFHRGYYRDLRL